MAKFSAWYCEPDHVDSQWCHDSVSPAQCFWCAYSDIRRPGVFGWHFGQQLALQFLHPSTSDIVLVRLWTSKRLGGFQRAVIVCLCAMPPPRWLYVPCQLPRDHTYSINQFRMSLSFVLLSCLSFQCNYPPRIPKQAAVCLANSPTVLQSSAPQFSSYT